MSFCCHLLPKKEMSHSFSHLVRVVKPEGNHRETFHAFCQGCALEVKPCLRCFTRRENINGLCVHCYNSLDFTPQPAETPCFLCQECEKWNDLEGMYGWEKPTLEQRFEIVCYSYKPYCACCPLSPKNFICEPIVKPIISNISPTPEMRRWADASQAYAREKEFSGNHLEAIRIWFSFFRDSRVTYSDELKQMRKKMRKRLVKLMKLRV